jgi:pantetheine-phosphate adenylyltransferase
MQTVKAIYPGTFDPLTNGHLDLIARGSKIVDELVVAILRNSDKGVPLFTVAERLEMIAEAIRGRGFPNVSVTTFDGLLVDFARAQGAKAVLRGIRAISDYEYEFQMAMMNRKLDPELETLFMMPAEKYTYVSSRLIKGVFKLGGDVSELVPPLVMARMKAKGSWQKTSCCPGRWRWMRHTTVRQRKISTPTSALRVSTKTSNRSSASWSARAASLLASSRM